MRIEDIYQEMLDGKRKQFPKRTWKDEEMGIRCTRYMIEEILKWSETEITELLTMSTFVHNRLGGMLATIYHNSPFAAINSAYPNRFFPWEFQMTPLNYWNEETGIKATKWLIEEKLKWSDEEIKEHLTEEVFVSNGLAGMLEKLYNASPYKAINVAYPERCFKPWEFTSTPNSYWILETGIQATRWLIEEKLKWTDNDIREKLKQKVFIDNGLSGMLNGVFNGSPYQAINAAYPNKFKPRELPWRSKITR